MSVYIIIGVLGLLAGVMISRILNEKALKTITSDEKVKLIDGFSKLRKYNLIPIIILIGTFFILSYFLKEYTIVISIGCFILLALDIVVTSIYTYKKLKEFEMPKEYFSYYNIARILSYLGFFIFICCLILDIILN